MQLTVEMCMVEIFEFRELESFVKGPVAKGVVKVRIGVRVQ
jgi:hypothetical protein